MTPSAEQNPHQPITKESRLSNFTGILPLSSLLVLAILVLLIYAFFTGHIYRFYASALFGFYFLTKKMWVSVILLGVFQTALMIPWRIIRLTRAESIKKFQEKVQETSDEMVQRKKIKSDFSLGNKTFLFYLVDFMVQLTTFLTLGRLFLTDFYTKGLDPKMLYSWLPYPQYPIRDIWFKIPYPAVTKTANLGWKTLLIAWGAIFIFQVLLMIFRAYRHQRRSRQARPSASPISFNRVSKYTTATFLLLLFFSWLIVKYFPTGLELRIFSGDVSHPNRTLNTITAISTFIILIWFGVPRIQRKGKAALASGIPLKIVEKTQQAMFSETVIAAFFIGLGAFFITNQIPSAFELSIFTLEVISLASPFTLDKAILRAKNKGKGPLSGPLASSGENNEKVEGGRSEKSSEDGKNNEKSGEDEKK